ncbi:MAG: hypothetical protein GXC94_06190 [Comamonadaceae bacterium]|jgi:hypothetical protein|nr:hypothetical protein [Comamonadaceae bacterium]
MRFPSSLQAEDWRHADSVSPPQPGRQFQALAIVALAALGAGATLNLVDDPRPLDVQISTALRQAGETLQAWQGQLERGLQVSLRAVADGQEHPPATAAPPRPGADERDPPARPDER